MSHSFCKIYLHIIFHIKYNSPEIRVCDWGNLYAHIANYINETGCQTIRVGGIGNHVHVLCTLSRAESVSHLVEEMKRKSSRWIKLVDKYYEGFAWQGGYAAFSVSQSVVPKTVDYIKNQPEHHKNLMFEEEYKEFLKLYGVEYNEQSIFIDEANNSNS